MNLAAMLRDAKPVEIPVRFVYDVIIKVWMNKNPQERYQYFHAAVNNLDKLTASNITSGLSPEEKVIKQVLQESRCFAFVDLDFIAKFKTKRHYNWFEYDTVFSSVKSRSKFEFKISICKYPHVDETVSLDRSRGNFHTFYSYYEQFSRELNRKYLLNTSSIWSDVI